MPSMMRNKTYLLFIKILFTLLLYFNRQLVALGEGGFEDLGLYDTTRKYATVDANGTLIKVDHPISPYGKIVFSEERESLHNQIIHKLISGKKSQLDPKIIFTAGLPGAGKSTVFHGLEKDKLLKKDEFVIIDPDLIKSMLPEYKRFGEVAKELFKKGDKRSVDDLLQAEAREIVLKLYTKALEKKLPIIYDGTMRDPIYNSILINNAQKNGYQPTILYVETSTDVALSRTKSRGLQEGRFVDEAYFQDTASKVPSTVQDLAKKFSAGSRNGVATIVVNNDSKNPIVSRCFDTKTGGWINMDNLELGEGSGGLIASKLSGLCHSAAFNRRSSSFDDHDKAVEPCLGTSAITRTVSQLTKELEPVLSKFLLKKHAFSNLLHQINTSPARTLRPVDHRTYVKHPESDRVNHSEIVGGVLKPISEPNEAHSEEYFR